MTQIKANFDEVTAWLQIAQQAPDEFRRESMITMSAAVGLVVRQVKPRTPVNTGALQSAWSTKVDRGTTAVKGEIMNPLAYAIVMEKGRTSPKLPPMWPIVYWLRRKFGMSLEAAIEASYPTRRAIARGTKAHKMLEDGFEAAEPNVKRLFDDIPDKVFNRLK